MPDLPSGAVVAAQSSTHSSLRGLLLEAAGSSLGASTKRPFAVLSPSSAVGGRTRQKLLFAAMEQDVQPLLWPAARARSQP